MELRFDGRSVPSLVVDSLDLVCGGGGFRRLIPNFMPVGRRSGSRTSTDNVKHELGPIITVSMQ